ncbi:MAG: hypothetical protein JWO82_3078 [Akkermansiaceae bacterium]|nr:hypothetical protein [Akkermansiaceae bacterium]
MKRFFQFVLAAYASLVLAGGPYALAQMVAWAGMLSTYSKSDGIAQAVTDTFSGERPCEMCKDIGEAKKEAAGKSGKTTPELTVAKQAPELASPSELLLPKPQIRDAVRVAILPPLDRAGICQAAPLLRPPRA